MKIAVFLMAVALLLSPAHEATASKVASPEEMKLKASQSGLVARWWQWRMNLPPGNDVAADPIDSNCGTNQPRDVWFLAGNFGSGTKTRSCILPKGRMIFFPVFSNADYSPRGKSLSCEEIKSRVENPAVSQPTEMRVQLDGLNVAGIAHFKMASEKCFKMFPNSTSYAGDSAYASGYWILIPELTVGEHVIRFYISSSTIGFKETKYHIRVDP